MRMVYANIAILIIFLLAIKGEVMAQVVATGHISAEIVESVSATSPRTVALGWQKGSDSVPVLEPEMNGGTMEGVLSGAVREGLLLGEVNIRSGNDVSFQLVTGSAMMADGSGNGFSIEPQVNGQARNIFSEGDQTLYIEGVAQVANSQASGIYQGAYTLVLAYN